MAGIQALINQSIGENAYSGNPNPRYYALGSIEYDTAAGAAACNSSLGTGQSSTCVFNDVTLGDTDVPCTGTINCYGGSGTGSDTVYGALSTSTSDLSIAYGAHSGWDFATGLGSVNVWNLIQNWTSIGTRTTVASNADTVLFGQSVTFTATIRPNIGSSETGTVSWSANTGCAVSMVSAGQTTCTTSALPASTNTVTATYSGDSNYSGSNGSVTATTQPAIAVGTMPSGLAFQVDGTAYASTQGFTWAIGSSHSLSTTASQTGPGAKYSFAGWSDGTTTVSDKITVSESIAKFTANFNASYQLNIAPDNAVYGTITPVTGSYYPAGTRVAITATAKSGYYFTGWTGSADIDNTANSSTTITMNAAENITANFVPIPMYQLDIAPNNDAWGSVTPLSGASYAAGTVVPLTATANPGYYFTGWTGSADIDSTANPSTTITMNAAENITANFAPIGIYQLNIALNNGAWGSVTPPSGSYYAAGTVVPLTAITNPGYAFVGWTGTADIDNTANPSTTITMNGPESITANFAPIPNLVVNTAADDFGTDSPSNCAPQPTPGTTTTADNCTLRDASDYANFVAGSANVSFDSTVFNAANTAAQNTITLSGSEIDILSSNISITGPTTGAGAALTNLVTVSGGNGVLDFLIDGATTVSINNLNIVDGDGSSFGGAGGIYSYQSTVSINGCVVSGNVDLAPSGSFATGGGVTLYLGTMTVSNSTISGNAAADNGGDGFSIGGGIYNLGGTLTVINSTFTGNTVSATGGDEAAGGGIASDGGTLTVVNSTLSGNSALASGNGFGGSIYNRGQMNLTGITVTLNSADLDGGAIDDETGPGVLNPVANSIITGNTAPTFPDIYLYEAASLVDNGGNQVTTGVALAPLANYGGTTQSQLPLPGDPSICGGLARNAVGTTDQRGLPFDPACPSGLVDSGAVQTNFAIAFSTEPASTVGINVPFLPVPTVELTESGNLLAPPAGPILMTDNKNLLGGTTAENTNAGYAAFNALTLSRAATSDTLTATLTLGYPAAVPQGKPAARKNLVANAKKAKHENPVIITANSSAFSTDKIPPTITWPTPAAITYGEALRAMQLNAKASVAGSFNYSPVAGTVLEAGLQTLSVTFTPKNSDQYASATATVALQVNPARLNVTAKHARMRYGASLPPFTYVVRGFVNGDTATAALTGAPALTTTATSQSPVGTYTIDCAAGTLAAANYVFDFHSGKLTTEPAILIAAANSTSILYGNALPVLTYSLTGFENGDTQASATTGAPTLSTTATATPTVGSYPIDISAGTLDAANYRFEFRNGTLRVSKTVPVINWPTPAPIAYGRALDGTELDATSPVSGIFSYAPPAGTKLTAGTHTLDVTFSPNDATDYDVARSTVSLIVVQASQTVTFDPLPANVVFGVKPIALSATSTSGLKTNFTVISGPGRISGSKLVITGTGTLTVAADQAGNADYAAAPEVTQTVVVN
jgi:large repetitive protein